MKISFVRIILLTIVVTGLTSCTQSPDCSRKDVFCIGLVTDTSGIQDYGLNQDAWQSMEQEHEEGHVNYVAYIESVDSRDYEKNIAVFAKDKYDVIITMGPGLRDETLHAAEIYPDSVFIGIDQPQKENRSNLLSVTFPEDQMGFWAGALAAHITETGIVAAVCETSSIDSMWRYCEGFRKGVTYVNKDIKVLVIYRENGSSEKLFLDSEWGHSAAQDFIKRGADVIFAAGGGTGQGALIAASDMGVHAIGAEQDQAQVLAEARPALITSVYGRAGFEVQKWTRLIRKGQAINGTVFGSFGHSPYQEVKIQIPDSIKSEMDQLLAALSTGSLKTGVPFSAP